jgi:hypothetical protein
MNFDLLMQKQIKNIRHRLNNSNLQKYNNINLISKISHSE